MRSDSFIQERVPFDLIGATVGMGAPIDAAAAADAAMGVDDAAGAADFAGGCATAMCLPPSGGRDMRLGTCRVPAWWVLGTTLLLLFVAGWETRIDRAVYVPSRDIFA